jgi:hypothetical protein
VEFTYRGNGVLTGLGHKYEFLANLVTSILTFFILLSVLTVQAEEIGECEGTVLQRRFALVQFGQLVDAYILAKGVLPDICATPVAGGSDSVPALLKDAFVCGSSEAGSVYYSCQISANDSPVIESCRYSLADQSMSCENRTMVTTFE